MNEIGVDVKGYENLYKVSNRGNVYSCRKEKLMRKQYNKRGYAYVCLNKNGNKKMGRIHRLVAMAFIPNPENKPIINHKNGIHDDNNINNLEGCTYRENSLHSYGTLGNDVPRKYKGEHPLCKCSKEEIYAIKHLLETTTIPMTDIAKRFGVSKNSVFRGNKEGGIRDTTIFQNRKARKVKDITTGKIYASCAEAARDIGAKQNKVWMVCNGKRNKTKDHSFKYID